MQMVSLFSLSTIPHLVTIVQNCLFHFAAVVTFMLKALNILPRYIDGRNSLFVNRK